MNTYIKKNRGLKVNKASTGQIIRLFEITLKLEKDQKFKNYQKLKRILDLTVTCLLIIPMSILSFFIIMIIKIESYGPAIVRQRRIGLLNSDFEIYKFRSMTESNNDTRNDFYTSDKITKFGRFIRKHRLDEIPQFWNVIKGDMSLIGPRPDILTYYRQCSQNIPNYSTRYRVKPGLTGWAQVNYPHCITIDCAKERLEFDLFYIENMSLFLDLKIILLTVLVMISGKGGR